MLMKANVNESTYLVLCTQQYNIGEHIVLCEIVSHEVTESREVRQVHFGKVCTQFAPTELHIKTLIFYGFNCTVSCLKLKIY